MASGDEEALRSALADEPRHLEARLALGRTLLRRGAAGDAVEVLREAEHDAVGAGLLARAELVANPAADPEAAAVIATLDEDPEGALERLIEAITGSEADRRDRLRRVMIGIFGERGNDDPLDAAVSPPPRRGALLMLARVVAVLLVWLLVAGIRRRALVAGADTSAARRHRARRRRHARRRRRRVAEPAGVRIGAATRRRAWQPVATVPAPPCSILAVTPHGRPAILVRDGAGLAVVGAAAPDPVPGTVGALQARVAADDAGHVVVVWDQPSSGSTVSIKSATRTGATWSAPAFVDVGSGQTWLHDLLIARGAAHLLYGVSCRLGGGVPREPAVAGGAWTPVTLAETGPGIGGDGDLAALKDGRLAAVFALGGRLRAVVGKPSKFDVLGPAAGAQVTRSALAQDARGDLVVTWSRASRVRSARRTAHGKAWHALPAVTLAGAGAPGLGRIAGGDLVLAVRARGRVLAYRRHSGSGAWTGRQTIAASGATGPVSLAGDGRLVAAWPAGGGIRVRLASRRP